MERINSNRCRTNIQSNENMIYWSILKIIYLLNAGEEFSFSRVFNNKSYRMKVRGKYEHRDKTIS